MVEPVGRDSRGILHPAAARAAFTLDRFAPGGPVARFVDRYWVSSWNLPDRHRHEQQVLVHPVVNVVFDAEYAIVSGVDTGRFSITLEGTGRVLGVMFRPAGFHPFAAATMAELTDRTVALREFTLFAGLEEAICPLVADPAAAPHAIAAAADAALAPLMPDAPQPCQATVAWAELAVRDRSLTRVEDFAAAVGVSVRTLQRAFTEYVGIGPKWFLRRYRLYEAGERVAHRERVDWAALAAELGYADQSHLTRDFTAAFGLPPAQYAAERR
jgi:AraC-like DNA-binding protein